MNCTLLMAWQRTSFPRWYETSMEPRNFRKNFRLRGTATECFSNFWHQ